MSHVNNIEHHRLLEKLIYEPESGLFFWRETGRSAGCVMKIGYRQICVNQRSYLAHRLAWFYVHGEWPKGDIDHINSDKLDNRVANLRDVPHRVNMRNRKRIRRDNRTGFAGVSQIASGKYMARITDNAKRYRYLGLFDTPEKAAAAYKNAQEEIYREEKAVA